MHAVYMVMCFSLCVNLRAVARGVTFCLARIEARRAKGKTHSHHPSEAAYRSCKTNNHQQLFPNASALRMSLKGVFRGLSPFPCPLYFVLSAEIVFKQNKMEREKRIKMFLPVSNCTTLCGYSLQDSVQIRFRTKTISTQDVGSRERYKCSL